MNTNTSFIFNDASYGEFRDIFQLNNATIMKFLNDHILSNPNSTQLLQNLSNIWLMVARIASDSPHVLQDNDTSWKDILSEKQYAFLKENGKLIIGYILFGKKTEDSHYIELCDTAVRGHNILKCMINKYKRSIAVQKVYETRQRYDSDNEPHILPDTIIPSASGYWKKYLQEKYKIETETQLTNWIQGIEDTTWAYTTHMCQTAPDLDYNIVRDGWEYLYENWNDINGRHDPNNDSTNHTLGNSQNFLNEL
jgi:hypothetical protein